MATPIAQSKTIGDGDAHLRAHLGGVRTQPFGRWGQYATDGHGGNIGLRRSASGGRCQYQVSVLEVVDENTPDAAIESIESIESYRKNKTLTRTFGLNIN